MREQAVSAWQAAGSREVWLEENDSREAGAVPDGTQGAGVGGAEKVGAASAQGGSGGDARDDDFFVQ